MKKIIIKIIQNKIILSLTMISIIIITLFTINYANQIEAVNEKIFEHYISPYENKEALKENLEQINLIIEKTKEENILPEDYERLLTTKRIYETILKNYVAYEKLYDATFFSKINDKTTYIDTISDIYIPLVLIFFITAFYLSFVSEFDDKTFIYLYDDKNRSTNFFKRLLASCITTTLFFLLCVGIVELMSLNLKEEITHILIIQKNHVSIITKNLYKLLFTYTYQILKIITTSCIMVTISLYTKKGMTVLSSMFVILAFYILSSMYFPNSTFILSMGRKISNYPFKTIYLLLISLLITIVSFIISYLSYRQFKKQDLI